MDQGFTWLPLPVRDALGSAKANTSIYLVGGAVRDVILGVKCRDYDFAMEVQTRQVARKVSDLLGGDFYPLDEQRGMMRVLWYPDARDVVTLDFATFQGGSLEADLQNRDFTINAMAVDLLDPAKVIDPLMGAQDLKDKLLRRCRQGSILDDPVRAMRAVRIAVQLELQIEKQTAGEIREAESQIRRISPERIRDELFRLMGGQRVSTAIRLLDQFGLLQEILPEVSSEKGVEQSKPHTMDVFEHSLAAISRLEEILSLIIRPPGAEPLSNLTAAQAYSLVASYREKLRDHYFDRITEERSRQAVFHFAALFHDTGKPLTAKKDAEGVIHNYGHETSGAELAVHRAQALACSNREVDIIEKIVKNHMRPNLLRKSSKIATPKAVYRYFRDCGEEGVDICIFSLADMLAKQAGAPEQSEWLDLLEINRQLLDAWYNHRDEKITPPRLLDGNDLMEVLGIPPGPEVGRVLEAITEAQVEGRVRTREDAIEFVRRFIS